jgi:hypothetical protein
MATMTIEDLVIDARDLDRELVGSLLAPYLRIDRSSCEVIPLGPWDDAPNEVRVLLYLLARRAMRALALPISTDAASPVEIERATGIPGGSVRPALKRLLKARAVAKQAGTGYIVPNYAMSRVREYIRPWTLEPVA